MQDIYEIVGFYPHVICGLANRVFELSELEGHLLNLHKISANTIDCVILSFHGYGERAETQVRRMQTLGLNHSILWICPQALHGFSIAHRRERQEIEKVKKTGWTWMAQPTRSRDILWNQLYMKSLYQGLKNAFKLVEEEMNDTTFSFSKLISIGHSQGASQAWRTASWIPTRELIIHAGDIPPELRQQWPKLMRDNLKSVVLGRSLDDEVMPIKIFHRDLRTLDRFSAKVVSWEGSGGHEWNSQWANFLRCFIKESA